MSGSDAWDALVVGSGATGGVAAMVLAEAGWRVLVVEAGPQLTASRARGGEPANSLRRLAALSSGRQTHQAQHPGWWKHNPQLFVDEVEHPWSTPAQQPFLWTRGRQVGGRSLTWGGITLRLSDGDFQAAERDGHGPCWPIGSRDLAPHYSRLERLLGVHGQADGLAQLPDGEYLPPLPFTPGEKHLGQAIARELGLPLIHSRGFRLHQATASAPWPSSSSPGSTLARALATGRVSLRPDTVVSHLAIHRDQPRAEGVVVVNADGGRELLRAPLVVLCASTIETLRILLHSQEDQGGGRLQDPSGCLGRHLMDHISTSRFFSLPGVSEPSAPAELSGAGSCFIPNTVNLEGDEGLGFKRGYGIWTALQRFDPPALLRRRPAEAVGFLIAHGEVLSDPDNRVSLEGERRDRHGLPTASIHCRWGVNEEAMVAHMHGRMAAVVAAAGGTIRPVEELFRLALIEPWVRRGVAVAAGAAPPGYYIHEMGGARLSATPEEGVVDPWNRCWGAANVLVSDGACWPTSAWQSPTLTSMALTMRACEGALERQRRGEG
ncbi:MAG: GMC oxidoreductase [Cyanobium sp.]